MSAAAPTARRMHNRGRLLVTGRIAQDPDEVLALIVDGLRLAGAPPRVEVHVKGRQAGPMSGYAWHDIPSRARCAPTAQWLVTITIPRALPTYPRVGVTYPGKARSRARWPVYDLADWREELVHLAAHEGRHAVQFAEGLPRSEMDAERRATAALRAWRAERR